MKLKIFPGTISFVYMVLMLLLGSLLVANDLNIGKVGDWGSGEYTDVAIYGNHAFLLAPATGLDIMDISNPSFPTKVAAYRPPLLSGSIPTSGVLHLEGSTALKTGKNGDSQ
jgi:hypothetical protein